MYYILGITVSIISLHVNKLTINVSTTIAILNSEMKT